MKQHKIIIGTISKGFREETYLLKEDVNKLIDESPECSSQKSLRAWLKSKINGENKK